MTMKGIVMSECAFKHQIEEANMQKVEQEIFCIAQEECAEVTQAISKIFRFGFSSKHPVTGRSNIQNLEEEVGDLEAMIALMKAYKMVDPDRVAIAKSEKLNKLKKWSNIDVEVV